MQTQAVADWQSVHLAVRDQLLLPNPVQWPLVDFDPQVDPQPWLSERGVPSDAPILLGVGTKAHQKGFDRLVAWFVALADRHPHLQLVLVGLEGKPYRARNQQADLLSRLSDRPELIGRVHFPGRVGNMASWYARTRSVVELPQRAVSSGRLLLLLLIAQGPREPNQDGI